jgi:hypothetical protein
MPRRWTVADYPPEALFAAAAVIDRRLMELPCYRERHADSDVALARAALDAAVPFLAVSGVPLASDEKPPGRPAKVELMGYRQHIGRVREVTLAGAQMLAVAALDGTDAVFPASSVYCITWLAEETLAVAAMPPELLAAGRECICPPGGSGVDELADCPVHGEGPF